MNAKTLAATTAVATIAVGASATDGGDVAAMPPVQDIMAMVTETEIDATSRQVERMRALGEQRALAVRMNMLVFDVP